MRVVVGLLFALCIAGCQNASPLEAASPTPTPTVAPTATPVPTPTPEPAWQTVRSVFHVHSPFSHDACDGDGLPGGAPNAECLADLRASICESGLGFVGLTDHPSHMSEYPFEQVLLIDAAQGDASITNGAGTVIGNRLACGGGRTVVVTAGYEANHTMPIGLQGHLPSPSLYSGMDDAMPAADALALVDGIKAGGGVAALAHAEQDDLSAASIVAAGFDAMEWYNPHGNFKAVLGQDTVGGDPLAVVDVIGQLDTFLLGSDSGADADLLYLVLLPHWPQAGFDKWREVQRGRPVTGILGSDVHQNISVDPVCGSDPTVQALCTLAAAAWPNALTLLLSGGQIVLTDGERIDGYDRLFRWLDNRVLALDAEPASIQAALRAGRNYGVFRVFGDPEGFSFTADHGDGVARAIGHDGAGPATLTIVAPVPVPVAGGAPFTPTDAASATVRVKLLRIDAAGTTVVRDEEIAPGATLTETATAPGAYSVEIWITPHHLAPALGSVAELADAEYLWLLTNAIHVR